MKKLLSWLFGIPAAVIVAALAVANRQTVRFSADPFSETDPVFAADVPLFVLLLAAVFVGILFGGAASWLTQRKWRRAAREARADSNRLKQERENLKREVADAKTRLIAPPPAA